MPYLKNEDRKRILEGEKCDNPGELNYRLTCIVLEYLGENPNYQRYNDAVGALAAVQMELYRRKVAPYEDRKIRENGDVYGQ